MRAVPDQITKKSRGVPHAENMRKWRKRRPTQSWRSPWSPQQTWEPRRRRGIGGKLDGSDAVTGTADAKAAAGPPEVRSNSKKNCVSQLLISPWSHDACLTCVTGGALLGQAAACSIARVIKLSTVANAKAAVNMNVAWQSSAVTGTDA